MRLTKSGIPQLAILLIAAVTLTVWLQAQRPLGTEVGNNAFAQRVRADRTSPTAGPAGADLTLIAFTDYRCPACRRAHLGMKRALARDGRVRLVYKDWPIFGAMSDRAAAVAIASSFQGIYAAVHDKLMTGRVRNDNDLRAAVESSGGNWSLIQQHLQLRRAEIDDQLERNRLQASGLGLGGTPGYLIGPILVRGALTQTEFRRAFAQARQSRRT